MDWKCTRYLRKDTHIMHLIHTFDSISIRILVLKKECSNVWLPSFYHILNRSSHMRISNRDGFIEPRKQWSFRYRNRHHLRIDFGNGWLLQRALCRWLPAF